MEKNQNIQIFKANALVQSTVNNLSMQQNRILCLLMGKYIIGAVQNDNIESKLINSELSVSQFLNLLELSDCADNYKMIRKQTEDFLSNCIVTFTDGSKHIGIMYFDKFEYDEEHNMIKFNWSNSIKPYLTDLSKRYTTYLQNNFLKLNSKRSQILYELMKSYQSQKFITFSLEDLKQKLDATKPTYEEFKYFNKFILKKCIEEINEITDIIIIPKTNKRGKNVVSLTFTIEEKKVKEVVNDIIDNNSVNQEILSKLKEISNNEFSDEQYAYLVQTLKLSQNNDEDRINYFHMKYLEINLYKPRKEKRFNYLKTILENNSKKFKHKKNDVLPDYSELEKELENFDSKSALQLLNEKRKKLSI